MAEPDPQPSPWPRPLPWMDRASCTTVGPDLWFPLTGDHKSTERARAICRWCPVAADCWAFVQQFTLQEGTYAGLTPDERGMAYAHMRRGA